MALNETAVAAYAARDVCNKQPKTFLNCFILGERVFIKGRNASRGQMVT